MMGQTFCAALMLVMLAAGCSQVKSMEWKPARGPLMTRWAKDVTPDSVLSEYPRPQLVRETWLNLNGLWELEECRVGTAHPTDPPFGRRLDGQVLVPFPIESALSGVMKHSDRVWYRRTFKVPKDWPGRRILLHLGAVDWESVVYVNGTKLGTHRGGYDAFSFDITDALSSKGEQELIVGVFDPTLASQARGKQILKPEGIFYTPVTGIWQTIWLEPQPTKSITNLVITPDVDGQCVRIKVVASDAAAGMAADVTVMDGDNVVASHVGKVGQEIVVPIPSIKLWSPDDPFLYGLSVSIGDGKKSDEDSVRSYFGMRKIEVALDGKFQRLMLNGEFVFQIGPLDQGFWPDGIYTAPTDEALRYDLEVTKKLGLNMIRKHVKIEPQRWYYWCDKLGIMVWQDMPSAFELKGESAQKQFELELRRMIEQHRNSPCIINWVVFNEGWGQYDKEGTTRLVNMVKALDPTRLVNNASGWTDMGVGDMADLHKYPGPGSPPPEKKRAVVLGEFGGLGLGVDGHTWAQKTWGYQGMASQAELTEKYVKLLGRLWGLKDETGLSAAVYTQTTDVETECNGLLTYDREVLKVDAQKIAAANTGKIPVTGIASVIATSEHQPSIWRYTFVKPADGWIKPDFDDSSWKQGPAGFGTEGTPGGVVRSTWNTPDIWLRRSFELPPIATDDVQFFAHHDEDVEICLNGVLAAKAKHFTTDYQELPMTEAGRKALRPGNNILAVHCHQTGGGQYIDVGIVRLVQKGPSK